MRNKVAYFILIAIGLMLINLDPGVTAVKKRGEARRKDHQTSPEASADVFFGYVRLVGTIYHSDKSGEKREAVIVNLFTKKRATYTEGSFLPCGVKLKLVKSDCVVLEKNGQQKTLSLHDKKNYFKEIKGLMKYGYQRIAPYEWIVSPHYLFKSSEELIDIAMSSRLAFNNSDNISGFVINNLPDGSKIVDLGFKPGDKVVNINGIDLRGLGSLVAGYQKMRSSENVTIKIQRAGKPVKLSYWVASKGSPRYNMQKVFKAVRPLFVM